MKLINESVGKSVSLTQITDIVKLGMETEGKKMSTLAYVKGILCGGHKDSLIEVSRFAVHDKDECYMHRVREIMFVKVRGKTTMTITGRNGSTMTITSPREYLNFAHSKTLTYECYDDVKGVISSAAKTAMESYGENASIDSIFKGSKFGVPVGGTRILPMSSLTYDMGDMCVKFKRGIVKTRCVIETRVGLELEVVDLSHLLSVINY